ncbi:leucine-rich repeat domain-containing protein [Ovoidimarina sediminis]|uniref:hypothetical protein n=1 Tax=Ovoidimarina sediminis TaxID=3079856 RepID=UPI00290D0F69|nr:hypothetical protein [Rhodophyticola sp. MJ-SS7]MDU8942919.1 hypothetical protein [Rhodophyticola sp. MJ-SS7]
MAVHDLGALRERYRQRLDGGPLVESAGDIPDDATHAHLQRVKTSHRGIGARTGLRHLIARATNQAFLDEICTLPDLEALDLAWPMRAPYLAPLRNLKKLKYLGLASPSKVTDFTPILELPDLEILMIENAQHMTDLEWMRPLRNRLRILGVEGSVNKLQRIPSLAPLRGFAFEALFLISTKLADKDPSPLFSCPNLRFLDTARIFSWDDFDALEREMPNLVSHWFDPRQRY